jgi:putative transposase
MTAPNMDLRKLLEETADSNFLLEMIGFAPQRLMELEVESLTEAVHNSRIAARLTHRNGYRSREWDSRAGTVEVHSQRL